MAERRRGKGEGSIYRRKDGRWVGQYEVNGERRYVYAQTRKEVAEKLNKAIAERNAGLVFDAKNLSVGEYLDSWLDTIRGTLAPNTVRRHEELARIHIKPALGKAKLSKLDPNSPPRNLLLPLLLCMLRALPPMYVSSASTWPDSFSKVPVCIASRILWSMNHAVRC